MPPSTCTAAVVERFGEVLQIREVRVPLPEPGALTVRVEATTLCGSDVHTWLGAITNLPITPPDHPRPRDRRRRRGDRSRRGY